ncbi:MAG: hypothetical protein MJ061_05295 [Mailhella sp.]|nr:hypothetical protein [Mailhella sp.]
MEQLDTRALRFMPCPERMCSIPLLSCLECRSMPCPALKAEHLEILSSSPFVNRIPVLKPRATESAMYVFRHSDGTLTDAPESFDPEKPSFEELADIDEILCISRVLVKQLRLVPKPREERAAIMKENTRPAEPMPDAPSEASAEAAAPEASDPAPAAAPAEEPTKRRTRSRA